MSATIHRLHEPAEPWQPLKEPYYWPPIKQCYVPPESDRWPVWKTLLVTVVMGATCWWLIYLGVVMAFEGIASNFP